MGSATPDSVSSSATRRVCGTWRRARAASRAWRVPTAARLALTTQPYGSMPARRRSSWSAAASETGVGSGRRHDEHPGGGRVLETHQGRGDPPGDAVGVGHGLPVVGACEVEQPECVAAGGGVDDHEPPSGLGEQPGERAEDRQLLGARRPQVLLQQCAALRVEVGGGVQRPAVYGRVRRRGRCGRP